MAVVRVEWAAEWSACLLEYALEVVVEGGSRLAGSRCARARPSFAGDLRLQQSRTGAYAIPLIPHASLTPRHSAHNAVHSCLQHAQAARHARLPPPAAREGPAPPGLSQDEVARSRMYTNTSVCLYNMLIPSQKEEHSG